MRLLVLGDPHAEALVAATDTGACRPARSGARARARTRRALESRSPTRRCRPARADTRPYRSDQRASGARTRGVPVRRRGAVVVHRRWALARPRYVPVRGHRSLADRCGGDAGALLRGQCACPSSLRTRPRIPRNSTSACSSTRSPRCATAAASTRWAAHRCCCSSRGSRRRAWMSGGSPGGWRCGVPAAVLRERAGDAMDLSVRVVCRPEIAAGFELAGLRADTAVDGAAARARLATLRRRSCHRHRAGGRPAASRAAGGLCAASRAPAAAARRPVSESEFRGPRGRRGRGARNPAPGDRLPGAAAMIGKDGDIASEPDRAQREGAHQRRSHHARGRRARRGQRHARRAAQRAGAGRRGRAAGRGPARGGRHRDAAGVRGHRRPGARRTGASLPAGRCRPSSGPGLLGTVLDGIGRPLARLAAATGDFMAAGVDLPTLDRSCRHEFRPSVAAGVEVGPGDMLGQVNERGLAHHILVPPGQARTTARDSRGRLARRRSRSRSSTTARR